MTDGDDTYSEFSDAVNMTAKQLESWLDTEESKEVGQKKGGSGESTGHEMGRRIIKLLNTKKGDLTEDDHAAMRKVVGYVKRHLAQRPGDDVTDTPWRYSLMNWGHDPKK
jgi:DNA topoisomerase VI subunit B